MDENDIIKIFIYNIYKKRYSVFYITAFIFIITFLYVFFIAKPMFKSTTTLYPVTNEENTSNKLQILASQFGFMGVNTTNDYNIPDVVKSKRIRELVLKKKWVLKNGREISLYKFWGFNSKNKKLNKEKALKKLDKLLSVYTNDETGLITISILTEDPNLSAEIVNFIVKKVTEYIQKQREKEKKKYTNFIDNRVKEEKNKLIQVENKLERFIEKNKIISGNSKLKFEYNRIKRAIDIEREIYTSLKKQSEMAKIEEKRKDPIIRILDIGEVPARKFKPKRLLILITSLIIGLIIGIINSFINWKYLVLFFRKIND